MTVWPLDDKDYTAESIGAFAGTRTRGVYSADDCFRVTAAGGFNIKLSPGLAWLKKDTFWGLAVLETGETSLSVEVGSGQLSRYVAVCVLLDKTANDARVALRYGEYSDQPVKPAPRRDAYFDEIIVATILQKPAQVEISASDIYDERMNEDLCGLMRDGVTGLPSESLYSQFMTKTRELLETAKTDSDTMLQTTQAESDALLKSIQDELAQIIGGTGFDPTPIRQESIPVSSEMWQEYSPELGPEAELKEIGYTFRAAVPVSGVIKSMTPYITLNQADMEKAGAQIASTAQTYNGGVYLYAKGKPGQAITALTAEFRKAVV